MVDKNPKVKLHTKRFSVHIIEWSYMITRLTVHFMCDLMSDISGNFTSIEKALPYMTRMSLVRSDVFFIMHMYFV